MLFVTHRIYLIISGINAKTLKYILEAETTFF